MKKLLLLLGVGLLFHACSSDSPVIDDTTIDPNAKVYDVTFELNDFDISTRSATADPTGKYVNYRVYYVDSAVIFINENTSEKRRYLEFIAKEGSLTPAQFNGKVSMKLPKGNYTIVAFASDKVIGGYLNIQHVTGGNPTAYDNLGIQYNDLTQDIFRGETDFSVGEASVSKNIKMQRPIGKINLALDDLDRIPSNVQSLVPVFNNHDDPTINSDSVVNFSPTFNPAGISFSGISQYLGGYYQNMGSYMSDPYSSIAIPKNQIANYNRQNPISFYFPNNQSYRFIDGLGSQGETHYLYLIGFDQDIKVNKNAKIVYKKLIKRNIQIVGNQSLTITGSILKDGVNLSINTEWGAPINQEF